MASEKISKARAGYQFHPDIQYTCQSCVMLKDLGKNGYGCAWFGPNDPVDAKTGGCNYFSHGAGFAIPWMALFTKEELGYLESPNGFSCKRCEHIDIEDKDCEKVDRNSAGDTPGEINPGGCCNIWEADRKRAAMPTEKLLTYIAAASKSDRDKSVDEFRVVHGG